MKRKWRANEKMERKWGENEKVERERENGERERMGEIERGGEMEREICSLSMSSLSHHCISIFSFSRHFLSPSSFPHFFSISPPFSHSNVKPSYAQLVRSCLFIICQYLGFRYVCYYLLSDGRDFVLLPSW